MRRFVSCAVLVLATTPAFAGPLPGAIFTTVADGTRVNANLYAAKEDVYLDGGPGANAPAFAAGLPAGDYYFQVTDPSGAKLLSKDSVACRRFTVGEDGFIVSVVAATSTKKVRGKWTEVDCTHVIDNDLEQSGAITVQLMPYSDTPNRGGVYKVWVTPVDRFVGDPSSVDNPEFFHGFVPAWSKTDNYKVRKRKRDTSDPPLLRLRKFHDADMSCSWGDGEEEISGWPITVTDSLGVTNTYFTPATVVVASGTWTAVEETPDGTLQTVSVLDGAQLGCYPAADASVEVVFDGRTSEVHEVVYGNVGLGEIVACKVYDRDADGVVDEGEPTLPGWRMRLTGTNVLGDPVAAQVQTTGADGCTTFGDLLPGSYVVEELMATATGTAIWVATREVSAGGDVVSFTSQGLLSGNTLGVTFTNACFDSADFGTKGYWHNKNGLAEIEVADLLLANALAPYSAPSYYFGAGDEPFDGSFDDGTAVDPANGPAGDEIAQAGTALAEVSQFLIDPNTGGTHAEQLAQQLLAFLFNTLHRLDHPAAMILLPSGELVSAVDLIDAAVAAWLNGTDADQTSVKGVLDLLNNSDALTFVRYSPCAVQYP